MMTTFFVTCVKTVAPFRLMHDVYVLALDLVVPIMLCRAPSWQESFRRPGICGVSAMSVDSNNWSDTNILLQE